MIVTIVLGMHFSGTSCLAEALIRAGVDFGKNLRVQRGPTAYPTYEDERIMRLHIGAMLWDEPKLFVPTDAARAERDRIVASYEGRDFGFKEPNTLFFTRLWNETSWPNKPAYDVRYVGTFRHPGSVAAHIAQRLGRTLTPADTLWCQYAKRLLELHDRHKFPLVCFDDNEADYRAALTRAVEYVCGTGAIVEFDLGKRVEYPRRPVSDEALALYATLKVRASCPDPA